MGLATLIFVWALGTTKNAVLAIAAVSALSSVFRLASNLWDDAPWAKPLAAWASGSALMAALLGLFVAYVKM